MLIFWLIDKIYSNKVPHKEDCFNFITQGTTSKESMTFSKIQKFCGKNHLPYDYFIGKEIIHNEGGSKIKKPIQTKEHNFIFFIIVSYGNQEQFPLPM